VQRQNRRAQEAALRANEGGPCTDRRRNPGAGASPNCVVVFRLTHTSWGNCTHGDPEHDRMAALRNLGCSTLRGDNPRIEIGRYAGGPTGGDSHSVCSRRYSTYLTAPPAAVSWMRSPRSMSGWSRTWLDANRVSAIIDLARICGNACPARPAKPARGGPVPHTIE